MPKVGIGKVGTTARGFELVEFTDFYDVKCSLQQSSLATEDAIWLGCDEANPRVLVPGEGWTKIDLPENTVCDTRMHLNREQVERLVESLSLWLDTGSFE